MKISAKIAIMAFAISVMFNQQLFSQENQDEPPQAQESQAATTAPAPQVASSKTVVDAEKAMAVPQPEEMSIYGEVKSTDAVTNSIKLQYYDYDSDEENTSDIILDKETKMENANSLSDIKQGYWIDAIYVVKEGKNIAKSIIVEKEEEEPVEAAVPAAEEKKAEKTVAE